MQDHGWREETLTLSSVTEVPEKDENLDRVTACRAAALLQACPARIKLEDLLRLVVRNEQENPVEGSGIVTNEIGARARCVREFEC